MKKFQDWNDLANDYTLFDAVTDWRFGYSIVEQLLKPLKGMRVLDYGCGSGKFTRRMRDLGAMVTGVDESANAISEAKSRDSEQIDYCQIKDGDLSFLKSCSFDYAVLTFVLCTIPEDEIVQRIINLLLRKLKPGGKLAVLDPHPGALGYTYVSMEREKPSVYISGMPIQVKLTGMKSSFFDYWRSVEDYIGLVEHGGFNIEQIIEPILTEDEDETFWKDERVQAPMLTILGKKYD